MGTGLWAASLGESAVDCKRGRLLSGVRSVVAASLWGLEGGTAGTMMMKIRGSNRWKAAGCTFCGRESTDSGRQ